MLLGTADEVQKMIDKEMSLQQIKTQGLAKKWQPWTDGFISTETWIGIVYKSLITEVSKKLTVSPYKDTVFKWGLLDSEQTHH